MASVDGRNNVAAKTRRGYTNESYQYARSVFDGGAPRRLPPAGEAQAFLEAQVMQYLASGGFWWAHPTGVAGVRLSASGLLVRLDERTVLADGTTWYPMAAYALDSLLPYAEMGLQVHGPIGLRVKALSKIDLLLSSVGQPARVVLRAQPGTNWRELLAERRGEDARRVRGTEFRPLWSEPTLTRHEREHLAAYPLVCDAQRDLAWLGSGLLRRIALFENHSSAYSTRSWIAGSSWVFELDTSHDVAHEHDVLLDRLTDPVWGLPLEVRERHCACRSAARHHRRITQCTYYLEHRCRRRGSMEIRFRSVEVNDRRGRRRLFTNLNSDPAWLARVLPPGSGGREISRSDEPVRGTA